MAAGLWELAGNSTGAQWSCCDREMLRVTGALIYRFLPYLGLFVHTYRMSPRLTAGHAPPPSSEDAVSQRLLFSMCFSTPTKHCDSCPQHKQKQHAHSLFPSIIPHKTSRNDITGGVYHIIIPLANLLRLEQDNNFTCDKKVVYSLNCVVRYQNHRFMSAAF